MTRVENPSQAVFLQKSKSFLIVCLKPFQATQLLNSCNPYVFHLPVERTFLSNDEYIITNICSIVKNTKGNE